MATSLRKIGWNLTASSQFPQDPVSGIGLTSFSPTSGYPSLDLYRHVYFIHTPQNRLHPFNHRILQPGSYVRRLLCVALDDYLVMAHENRHGTWALVPTLP